MLAVKNSMKRSLVRGPAAVIAAGNMSMPARMSAGGAATTSSAVKTIGSFGSLGMDPPPPHPPLSSIIKQVMRDKKGRVQSSAGAQPAARSRPRGRRSAIDRAILLRMVRLRAEFVEQRLRVFQICRVEAFGEPGVDVSEH